MSTSSFAASLCVAAVLAATAVPAFATQDPNPASDLQNSVWVMTHVDKNTPVSDALTGKVTLQFRPHSQDYPVPTIIGFGGCNIFNSGVFDIAQDQISGVSTPVLDPSPEPCSADAISTQDAYFNVLGNNPLFYIENDNLTLIDGEMTVLRFIRKGPTH